MTAAAVKLGKTTSSAASKLPLLMLAVNVAAERRAEMVCVGAIVAPSLVAEIVAVIPEPTIRARILLGRCLVMTAEARKLNSLSDRIVALAVNPSHSLIEASIEMEVDVVARTIASALKVTPLVR